MRRAALLALLLAAALPAPAQQVAGTIFEDRDADGIRDPGEPALDGVPVQLFGTLDGGVPYDETVPTGADGSFAFTAGSGCFLLRPEAPDGYRAVEPRFDGVAEGTPGYRYPVGRPRLGMLDQGIANLGAPVFRYGSMGDSIAWNWNSCLFDGAFWYSEQVRARLACVAPGTEINLGRVAVKGEETDDLLVDDTADWNNVFRAVELQPHLITISLIGNDLLDVEPPADASQYEIDRAAAEILDARRNLQEAVSVMVSQIPAADITINTLYDNLAYRCYTAPSEPFHRIWIPIINQILRDLAWGQVRRAGINEVAAEFGHEDLAGGCTGFSQMICRDIFQTDQIHPNNAGYVVIREKVWEAVGGVLLGSQHPLGDTGLSGADHGYLRRVRRLLPTSHEARHGAVVEDPEAALDDADGGAPARIALGAGSEEFRVSGFPDWFDEIEIVKTVAGVRYRTTGAVADDFYRMEASEDGVFAAPPGHAYTPFDWNYYTPLVGGGGPNQPAESPDYPDARILALPDVTSYREVSATLTGNPVPSAGGDGYAWPPLDAAELGDVTIRAVAAPVAGTPGNDGYAIELDAAWLDLYGWEHPRPAEVTGLEVEGIEDGTLVVSFDELPGAARYNLYFGRTATLAAGGYDHGATAPAGPLCDATTLAAGPGRRRIEVPPGSWPAEGSYLLVTAHVEDVESPAGFRTDGVEIARSQSTCR
ncbi:MAG: GDSL-type esterase/lipase family protein [Acidobacteriota bacterium]